MSKKFIGKVCIVRANGAGVFLGEVVEYKKGEALLKNVRRIWRWEGAASIDELAVKGVSKPGECKFPTLVGEKLVTNVLEIIPATQQAIKSIMGVKEWTLHK